jgi:hypothetical protein
MINLSRTRAGAVSIDRLPSGYARRAAENTAIGI